MCDFNSNFTDSFTYFLTTQPTNEYKCNASRNINVKQAKWKKCMSIDKNLHISSDSSCIPGGNKQIWAKSKDTSIFEWIILEPSHTPVIMNSIRVADKNPINISEAARVNIVAVVWNSWINGDYVSSHLVFK